MESHEDLLKLDKDEILVQLEKGEGTLKIEKVAVKKDDKDTVEKDSEVVDEKSENVEETTGDKKESEVKEPEDNKENPSATEELKKDDEVKSEADVQETQSDTATTIENDDEKQKTADKTDVTEEDKPDKVDKPEEKTEVDAANEEACTKQAAELKAMFPDLEVIQPSFSKQTETEMKQQKWFREYALQVRLQHVVHCIEHNEWPVNNMFTAYLNGLGAEMDAPIHESCLSLPKRDTSTPLSVSEGSEIITITTDHGLSRQNQGKKRKRHIAIDVETERAKLHALLNNSQSGSGNNNIN